MYLYELITDVKQYNMAVNLQIPLNFFENCECINILLNR